MLRQNLQGSTMSFMTPALGFASNLSYTIIHETQEDDDRSEGSDDSADTTISITDAELALLGPAWAKEGMLCRKQYNETTGKRAPCPHLLCPFQRLCSHRVRNRALTLPLPASSPCPWPCPCHKLASNTFKNRTSDVRISLCLRRSMKRTECGPSKQPENVPRLRQIEGNKIRACILQGIT